MKILVVRLGRIGDMVLSTPLLYQLKKQLKGAEIDVLASRDNDKILSHADYINRVYVFDKNPLKLVPLILKLRRTNYDYFLDPKDHYSNETNYLAKLLRAKQKIGFKKDEKSIFDLDVSDYNKDKVHFQDKTLSSLRAFGIEPDFEENTPLQYKDFAQNISKPKINRVVVNIYASHESKHIPYDMALTIVNFLLEKGAEPLIISSPNNSEINGKLSEESGAKLVITKSILDTCEYLHQSKALISADTSLVHIACTYNTPVMVISRSIQAELEKFAPKSEIGIIIKSESAEKITVSQEKIREGIYQLLKLTH